MEQINDYTRYTTLMRNGFYDKLFFVDKLFGKWETLADYGCADGFLTKLIAEVFPDKEIVGYDEDPRMLPKQLHIGGMPENVSFTHSAEDIDDCDVINLCSVLHEVYSYCDKEYIEDFWKRVFSSKRKFVIIRDMISAPSDMWWSAEDRRKKVEAVRNYATHNNFLGELKRFENIYGQLMYPQSMMQFLLKYPYVTHPNWQRELNENYLAVSSAEISSRTPHAQWDTVYHHGYCLPYLRHKWKEDFGFDLNATTHAQIILKRR